MVITETYLAGVLMCKDYSAKLENNMLEKEENNNNIKLYMLQYISTLNIYILKE